MNTRTRTSSPIAAALVLTIGIAIVWATVVIWSYSLVAQFMRLSGQVSESVQVAMDGTPVIATRSYDNYLDTSFRTLDGQLLPDQREEWLTGASLPGPRRPPVLWESPVSWSERIAGLSDAKRPPLGWYVVRDERPIGRAYMVGYDEPSNLPIGYIGRGGFRRSLPPTEEWFDFGRRRMDYASNPLTTTGSVVYGGRANYYTYYAAADQRLPTSLVFLIDGDRLLEIDLRARTLRTLHESPRLISVAGLHEARAAAPAVVPAANETAQNDAPDTPTANPRDTEASYNPQTRIALRTVDKIILLDPLTGSKREYAVPDRLRDKTLQAYAVGNEQLLVQWWVLDRLPQHELMWLNTDGSIARQEIPALNVLQGETTLDAAIMSLLAMPIPLLYVFGSFVGIPTMLLQTSQMANYAAAVANALQIGWLGLIVTPLVGAALAWWTYRLQRQYHRPATGAWCAFVFLLGWPAFLAYWVERRRPKLEACGECGTHVPRDREACASCETVFAPPLRLGTEIFA